MIKAIRGFKDILPQETAIWQYIETVSQTIFHLYGFAELRLPVLEDTALFVRSIGQETDIVSKEMYTFADRKGHSLTLRPEGTASVVRAVIEHNLISKGQALKVYYKGPMFRYERPQAGRTRQFHQIGAEIFGPAEPQVDAELLLMIFDLFLQIGLKDIGLFLNSVGCPECRPIYKQHLLAFLEADHQALCPDCQERYEKNPLRVLDCKNVSCQAILNQAPVILEHLCSPCRQHQEEVERLLNLSEVPFKLNHRLVRGLDYYTRTAFEVTGQGLGAQNALAGGGRYDYLVESFGGTATPAIGFALGIERVVLALQSQSIQKQGLTPTKIYLAALGQRCREKAFLLARSLRQHGFSLEMSYQERSLKSQLKQAGQMGAGFTLILGDEELASNQIILRDMGSSTQETVPIESLFDILDTSIVQPKT